MSLKDNLNLSTDSGTNVLAILTPILAYVLDLPESAFKKVAVILVIVAISVNLFLIRGNKAAPEQAQPLVDPQATVKEILDEGRK